MDLKMMVRTAISGGRMGAGEQTPGLSSLGNQVVDLGQNIHALRAASGRRLAAVNGNGSTFLAPITAYPTTTLTMALYNPAESGRRYYIDKLFSFLASGTPGVGGLLLACVTSVAQARPTLSTGANGGYAGTVISALNGSGAPGDTQAAFVTNITLTGAQPAWVPVASEPAATVAATIGTHGLIGEVGGGMEIRPGSMLGLAYLSAAGTTPLFGFGAIWDEYEV